MTWKEIIAWVGGVGTIITVIGMSLWGVPHYINTEVERRMVELTIDPATAPAVVTLQADMQNVKESQVRIEAKVDKFSQSFLAYLERQAQ